MSARNLRAAAERILGQAQNFAATSLPTTGEIPGMLADYAGQYRDWLGRGGGAQDLQSQGARMFSPEAVRYVTQGGERPAFASDDPDRVLGNVMDLISPAAKVGGLLGMLAGPGAKTANPRARALAEAMKGRGLSDEQIWEATGKQFGQPWWLGHPDQVPRFELSDEMAMLSPYISRGEVDRWGPEAGIRAIGKDPNEAVMMHSELQSAYPEMANLTAFGGVRSPFAAKSEPRGGYTKRGVYLNAPVDQTRSTLLHELQHGIQRGEGMATATIEAKRTKALLRRTGGRLPRSGIR